MGLRQVRWAQAWKNTLRESLGGCCSICGTREKLQFDCIKPTGHFHHRIGLTWRMSFYRQQFFHDNLQLLCDKCHNVKSSGEIYRDNETGDYNSNNPNLSNIPF